MKQIAKVSIALAAAAAVAVPLALAGTGGGRTLELVSVEQQFAAVPRIEKSAPPQVGGRLMFRDLNYNRVPQFGKPAGALIGRSEGICTLIAPNPPQAQCLITAHAPDGQIVVAGEGDPGAKVTHYAILGGLGAYAGARGTVTATALSETKSLVVVHLAG
jgi:hypothetical protein